MSDINIDDLTGFKLMYNNKVNFIRLTHNDFLPLNLNIKAELYSVLDDSEEIEDGYNLDLEIGLAKIDYFLGSILTNSIFMSSSNEWAMSHLVNSDGVCDLGNNIVLTPFEPLDNCISLLLHSKMNAFLPESIKMPSIEITNEYTNMSTEFFGNPKPMLPTMDEWVGKKAYFKNPWWERNDGTTLDTSVPDGHDKNVLPSYYRDLKFIEDTYKPKSSEPKILKPDFKPKVIKR